MESECKLFMAMQVMRARPRQKQEIGHAVLDSRTP
jgi:hypothetical protein